MTTYRLEVRADYPQRPGHLAEDVAAEVVTAAAEHDVEIQRVAATRVRGTDLVSVPVAFDAPDDATARTFCDALPNAIRWANAEADSLRTGTGRRLRRIR